MAQDNPNTTNPLAGGGSTGTEGEKQTEFRPFRVFNPVSPAWQQITYQDLAKPLGVSDDAITEVSSTLTSVTTLGVGTASPTAPLEVAFMGTQLKLTYDVTNYTTFTTGSTGDLTIAPSGADVFITGNLTVSGTPTGALTLGSVLFAGASGVVSQNNSDFFWDNTNSLLKARRITAGVNMSLGGNLEAGNFFSTYTSAQVDASNPNCLESHAVWSDSTGSPSGTIRGMYTQARLDRAAAFTGTCNAFLAEALTFAACTVSTLVGISGSANVQSGGTGTDCYGFQGGSYVLAAGDTMTASACVQGIGGTFNGGTIGSQIGVRSTLDAFGGTITNWYGYKMDILTFSGGCVITNLYGLYLPAISGASTLNYAIYSAGGNSYHAGNFGFNTTTPRRLIDSLSAAAPQMRLTYTDNSVYTDFTTDSSGSLVIAPTNAKIKLSATSIETDTSTGLKIGTGTTQKVGFFNATPVAQATGGQNVTNNVTNTASTDGTIPDITNGTVYATDYTNLRNALYQLSRMLKQDHDQLRAMGILT